MKYLVVMIMVVWGRDATKRRDWNASPYLDILEDEFNSFLLIEVNVK